MQLLKLVESEVQIGVPLPWNVRNQDCTLLLAKGYVIRDETQLEMLLDRGIFVDLEEVSALEALKTPVQRTPDSIFVRWTSAIDELEVLLTSLDGSPDFVPRIETLARTILDLASQDGGCAEFCVNGQSTAGESLLVRKHNDNQEARSTARTADQSAGQLQEA